MFLLLITTILLLLITYYYLTSPYNHWKKLNVPGPEVTSWLGHIPSIWHNKQNYTYEFADIYRKYRSKQPFVGIFVLRTPQLLLIDPKIVKTVLVQKFKCFRDNFFSDPVSLALQIFMTSCPSLATRTLLITVNIDDVTCLCLFIKIRKNLRSNRIFSEGRSRYCLLNIHKIPF